MVKEFNLKEKIDEWIEELKLPKENYYSKDGKLCIMGLTIDKDDFEKLENIHKELVIVLKEECNRFECYDFKENIDKVIGERLD